MGSIIAFRSQKGVSAQKQVNDFIVWAKGLKGLDKPDLPLNWSSWNWSLWVSNSLTFVRLGVDPRSRSFDPLKDLLDPQIMDFAKAYVLQKQSRNTTKEIREVVAVRAVEAALLELRFSADITKIDLAVYDRAADIIKSHYTEHAAYMCGTQLQKLSEFISENGLSESSDKWINWIKRPTQARGHIKSKKDKEKKMPNQEALDALAEIWFSQPTAHRDIYTTCNCVLLLSAPGRAGELNLLAVDAITYKVNSDGKPELFLNWYGQKGFGFSDKPVPEMWSEFTVEAFRRLKDITEEPRKLAKWLEENPDEFPVHEGCPKIDQDLPLSPEQVFDALCRDYSTGSPRTRLKNWLKATLKILNKSPLYEQSKTILQEQLDNMFSGRPNNEKVDIFTLTLRKLNVLIREYWLPPHFPYTDGSKKMKYQNVLNCFFEGQLHSLGGGYLKPYSLQALQANTLNNSLSIPDSESGKKRSDLLNIFKRWGYTGDAYSITTHQFRHYLDTLAAKGRVGEIERARWAGRLDVSQNKVYNHISDEEHIETARTLGLGRQSTSLATLSSKHQPILLKDLGVSEDRIAHYTEYGVCVHDFAAEPCTKYRDCLTCKKHKCIKGDSEKERRIRVLRDGLERTLRQATHGVEQEFYGADRWLTYTMDRLEKANELISILENSEIAEGAVIVCSDNGYSPLGKGLAAQGLSIASGAPTISSDKPKRDVDLQKIKRLLGR